MSHAPQISSISKPLVRVFERLVSDPGRWFSVDELAAAASAGRATVYRRCGNLAAAAVLHRRRSGDQAEFKLRPGWDGTSLGRELARRLPAR